MHNADPMNNGNLEKVNEVTQKQTSFKIEGMGTNDQLPYSKADFVMVCRVGPSIAISFYQMDYQDAINASIAAETAGTQGPIPAKTIPVAKVVLDEEGFQRLINETNLLVSKTASPK